MNTSDKQYATQIAQIASIMRTARKSKGFTQSEVAEKLGITQGTLSKIEQGVLVVSTPIWFRFCDVVKISPLSFIKSSQ